VVFLKKNEKLLKIKIADCIKTFTGIDFCANQQKKSDLKN
jgi:hypothetical protein